MAFSQSTETILQASVENLNRQLQEVLELSQEWAVRCEIKMRPTDQGFGIVVSFTRKTKVFHYNVSAETLAKYHLDKRSLAIELAGQYCRDVLVEVLAEELTKAGLGDAVDKAVSVNERPGAL